MKTDSTRALLTILIVVILALLIAGLFFIKIPAENKDLVNIGLGFIAGMATTIVTYYFGSSDGSRRKTDMLADQATGKPGDPINVKAEENINENDKSGI